jgi:hypothetical protein
MAPGPALSSGSKLQLPEAGAVGPVGVEAHEGEFSAALAASFASAIARTSPVVAAGVGGPTKLLFAVF